MVDTLKHARTLVKKNRENFPVASLLLPKKARAPILALYTFARHADDIADDLYLPDEEKLLILERADIGLSRNLEGSLPSWALPYYRYVKAGVCSQAHGRDLLSAFKQDVLKQRYDSWDELLDYCMRSAAPIGRSVLEACNEREADLEAADALCNSLQIINHLQDIREDYKSRNRIYLPMEWMHEAGCTEVMLGKRSCEPSLRHVINQAIESTRTLLHRAAPLPTSLQNIGIKLEVGFIYHLALQLLDKLEKEDPLAHKVRLSFWEKGKGFLRAW